MNFPAMKYAIHETLRKGKEKLMYHIVTANKKVAGIELHYTKTKGKYKYKLTKPYSLQLPIIFDKYMANTEYIVLVNGLLLAKEGYAWKANWPAINNRTIRRGSLVHDCLYQLIREGYLPNKLRKEADCMLRDICLEDGMWPFRAWYVYRTVRLFGWMHC